MPGGNQVSRPKPGASVRAEGAVEGKRLKKNSVIQKGAHESLKERCARRGMEGGKSRGAEEAQRGSSKQGIEGAYQEPLAMREATQEAAQEAGQK